MEFTKREAELVRKQHLVLTLTQKIKLQGQKGQRNDLGSIFKGGKGQFTVVWQRDKQKHHTSTVWFRPHWGPEGGRKKKNALFCFVFQLLWGILNVWPPKSFRKHQLMFAHTHIPGVTKTAWPGAFCSVTGDKYFTSRKSSTSTEGCN